MIIMPWVSPFTTPREYNANKVKHSDNEKIIHNTYFKKLMSKKMFS